LAHVPNALDHDVHAAAEQLLEPNLEAGQIPQRAPRFQGHDEVDVTLRALSASRRGPEQPDIPRAARCGGGQNLGTKGRHVVADQHTHHLLLSSQAITWSPGTILPASASPIPCPAAGR
jgi:hypothetical protein